MKNKGKLFFFCGKMGAGKSTKSKLVASENRAALISEDEWLAAHYPDQIKTFDDYIKHFTGVPRPNSGVLTVGHYAKHLKRWFKYFARNQLFIIIMETFKKSPFTIMEQLQGFLEIPVFDYTAIAEKGPRGFWVIKGKSSKAYQPLYPPMSSQARQLLNDYYAPHNQELKSMFPEIDFPW